MDLIYSFDPERFCLGTPCKNGHYWPGTQLSLRRIDKSLLGATVNPCIACTTTKTEWLTRFIDAQAMGFPEGWSFGKLCKAEHRFNGHEMSLRNRHKKCLECEKIRNKSPHRMAAQKAKYQLNIERNRACARERMRCKVNSMEPEELRKHREARRAYSQKRAERGRQSRAKGLEGLVLPRGRRLTLPEAWAARKLVAAGHSLDWKHLEPLVTSLAETQRLLWMSIKNAGHCPSVARLVMDEQRRYWRENPDAKKAHDRRWDQATWWLNYQTRPELRLYTRQKSKRRKAMMRGSVAIQATGKQVRMRFQQFDNRCAYCGVTGDLHIEHVVPISKGGTHAIGNIVPACCDCNYSKKAHEVESWYRQQSFFSELRWRRICRVLEWQRSSVGQLALL